MTTMTERERLTEVFGTSDHDEQERMLAELAEEKVFLMPNRVIDELLPVFPFVALKVWLVGWRNVDLRTGFVAARTSELADSTGEPEAEVQEALYVLTLVGLMRWISKAGEVAQMCLPSEIDFEMARAVFNSENDFASEQEAPSQN